MTAFKNTSNAYRHLVSLILIVCFLAAATGSTSSRLTSDAFYQKNKVEDKTAKQDYVEREDGKKIYGEKVTLTTPLIGKTKFHVDGTAYDASEIRGYLINGVYYARLWNRYIRRIIHGKINVYRAFELSTRPDFSSDGSVRYNSHYEAAFYSQTGEGGALKELSTFGDIKKLIADCPAALKMLEMKNGKIWKQIRHDPNYLNEVFDVYNDRCK